MTNTTQGSAESTAPSPLKDGQSGASLQELLLVLLTRWRLLSTALILGGLVGFGIATALPKWYRATTVILPPQQQQSSAAAAVAQLGALAGLAGNIGNIKSPADQYVALMQSVTVSNRLIDRFKLLEVYGVEFHVDARRVLASKVRILTGKKDGLLTVSVEDNEPARAADIANAYVDSLRELTTRLAVTEAQQRRAFFEEQMKSAQQRLLQAQIALDKVGVGRGVLKAEPKSAAESYARLRAESMAAEVRLQSLRLSRTDSSPEVQQQLAALAALREQIRRAESQDDNSSGSEYVTKYRAYKYEEALFDIFAKQYELARVDESREGALIQVVDKATTPERKAGPRRAAITAAVGLGFLLIAAATALFGQQRR